MKSRPSIHSIRVLHVDDKPNFGDIVSTALEGQNDRFSVESVTSARDGIDLLSSTEYDCVVSDYEMPNQNGIEFLKAVREKYPDLPFILFTGKGVRRNTALVSTIRSRTLRQCYLYSRHLGGRPMTKKLDCPLEGCHASILANTEEDVMDQAEAHVKNSHPELDLDDETVKRIRSKIQDF